ncbi:MAG: glycosyltransferase family 4 protein [Phycisphaerales bacterium]|nr:glycosyltransferase family 4 protein [Phycisphaerales bacterium]
MRILHISTRLILGGSQENTILSCEGQADLGHTVALAFGPIFGPEGSLLDRIESHGGVETIQTRFLERELKPVTDLRCYRELRRLIRVWKPDIVHTHSSKAGVIGRAAAWKEGGAAAKLGVVHTIHGLPYHPYQSALKHRIYITAERFAARRCHAIICVADAMTTQSLAAGVGRPEQYVTVRSGMETHTFLDPSITREAARRELSIEPGDLVFGTVARLAELKGHDDLLDALGDALKEHPNWKLLWVGDGWWADRLLGRVREMGLTSQVISTGLVPPADIPKMMQAMDVLIHPSYREGLPRTVPQALLSDVPVIAYDVDGTREACIPDQTGILVKPGDLPALRDAVVWMATHEDERSRLAQTGRALCEEEYAAPKMVERLEQVYEDILAGRPLRQPG